MRGQKQRILEHLKNHGTISSMQAFQLYGITRLAARVFELRELGYDIRTMDVETVNRYDEPVKFANYYLKGEKVR